MQSITIVQKLVATYPSLLYHIYTIDIPCIFITCILGEALEVRLHQVCVLFLNWTLVHNNMAYVAIPLEFIYSVAICCTLPM